MRLGFIRLAFATTMIGVLGSMSLSAQGAPQQPPTGTNNGVQVAVPQGSTADQAQEAARQNRQQAARNRLANQPAPRDANGHIVLGNTASLKGVWIGGNLGFCNGNAVAGPASLNPGAAQQGGRAAGAAAPGRAGGFGRGAAGPCTPIPYMAWTRAVSDDRRRMQLEPHTRCKPSGGPRQWLTPYGAEFLELPEAKVAYIFDIGGPHTYRTIYMDGRQHPANVTPSFYGHSIGSWEGDTLVVDTVGFNDRSWLRVFPHTEMLHVTQRLRRPDLGHIEKEITIEDPGTFRKPWQVRDTWELAPGEEIAEYICHENERDVPHLK